MSNDPLEIPHDRLLGLLAGLGLDPFNPNDIRSVHIEPGRVTVERYRRTAEGRMLIAEDDAVTETTVIRIGDREAAK